MLGPGRVVGIHQIADFVSLVQPAVQPGANDQLLLAAGIGAALMLPALEAGDRALVHEVVPTADREAGDVHFVEMQRAILVPPVVVVGRMAEPLLQQAAVVVRIAAVRGHSQEPLRPGGAADAVAFVKQAEARIDHVLAFQVRRLRNGQKVLGVASLRAAERADLARAPRLLGEPFARVVAVLQLAPAQRPVADPGSFRQVRAAEVDQRDDIARLGQLCRCLPRGRSAQVGIALLEQGRPRALARRQVQIGRKSLAVAHRDHLVPLGDRAQFEFVLRNGDTRTRQPAGDEKNSGFHDPASLVGTHRNL